jgi:hypothetical protein
MKITTTTTTTTTTTPDTSDWVLTTIPFSGFYETVHSMAIDDEGRAPLQDAGGDTYEDLVDTADNIPCDYRAIRAQYAQAYADALCTSIGIPSEHWMFDELFSPREYNFTTDRIFIKLHPDAFTKLAAYILTSHGGLETFCARCAANFTSRDGFCSSYDPDHTTWNAPDTWDHNQVGVLFETLCCTWLFWGDDCADQYEYEQGFAFELNSNGALTNMIDAGYKAAGEESYAAWLALCDEAYNRRSAD